MAGLFQERQQGVVIDGLDQVIVEPRLEGASNVFLVAVARDRDVVRRRQPGDRD